MSRRDPTGVVVDELRASGIEPTAVKMTGRGHHKMYYSLNGRSRFIVCAHSPSDWRAEANK
jgi:hypothetical protein